MRTCDRWWRLPGSRREPRWVPIGEELTSEDAGFTPGCSSQLEQTLTALREELARSEARWGEEVGKREGATQRRVERAQRESQDLKAEITMQITDKGKLEEELQTCK